jgi:hypothetical protein
MDKRDLQEVGLVLRLEAEEYLLEEVGISL